MWVAYLKINNAWPILSTLSLLIYAIFNMKLWKKKTSTVLPILNKRGVCLSFILKNQKFIENNI